MRTPVGCLEDLGKRVFGSVLPILHEGGGGVRIAGYFPPFLIEDVLYVCLLPEGCVKESDLTTEDPLFPLQFRSLSSDLGGFVVGLFGNGFRLGLCLAGLLCELAGKFRQTGSELTKFFPGGLDGWRQ